MPQNMYDMQNAGINDITNDSSFNPHASPAAGEESFIHPAFTVRPAGIEKNHEKVPEIMIVDDSVLNLNMLVKMLGDNGYRSRPFTKGISAFESAVARPPDMFLLDINMPEINGFELCRLIKGSAALSDKPVIFISSSTEPLDKVKAFGVGGIDYITKPFQIEEVMARVKSHLTIMRLQHELVKRNEMLQDMIYEQVNEIKDSQLSLIKALTILSEKRDENTGKHIERIQSFTTMIATSLLERKLYPDILNPNYISDLFHASPLHDIGKVAIPDKILLKPGRLTSDEFEVMKMHTLIGAKTLEKVNSSYPKNEFINMGINIAKYHHEKWDGSGYPLGISETRIPLCARIMAICDAYDAMRSKRVYKEPFSHEMCVDIIKKDSGKHFDPDIVACFMDQEKEFNELWG